MLSSNINADNGLDTGTMDTVTEIQMKNGQVYSMAVKFDYLNDQGNVECVHVDYELVTDLFVISNTFVTKLCFDYS